MSEKTNTEEKFSAEDIKSEINELRARIDRLCAYLCEQETKSAESDDFLIEGNVLIKYKGNGGRVVIPYGIKTICDNAFERSCITEVVIPSTVKKIGKYVFSNCEQLTRADIPDGVEEIGEYAFSCCKNLELVTIPNSVKKIAICIFSYCPKVIVCCEAKKKPEEWSAEWDMRGNSILDGSKIPVQVAWDYKG